MWCAWSDTFCLQRGGGQVFKTLHWLVQSLKSGRNSLGAVVIEDDSCASRHLRQCVLEHRLKILVHNLSFNLLGAISFRICILQFFVSGMKLFFFLQHVNWVINCLHSGKVVEANICQWRCWVLSRHLIEEKTDSMLSCVLAKLLSMHVSHPH